MAAPKAPASGWFQAPADTDEGKDIERVWKDDGDTDQRNSIVLLQTEGGKYSLKPTIELPEEEAKKHTSIQVTATANGATFTTIELVKGEGNTYKVADGTVITMTLTDTKIRTIAEFKINWKWSPSGTPSNDAGESQNKIYVSRLGANAANAGQTQFETVIRIGVDAMSNPNPVASISNEDMVRKVAAAFTTLDIKDGSGKTMKYDHSVTPKIVTTEDMLKQCVGRCDAWDDLFHDVLMAQGLDSVQLGAFPPPTPTADRPIGQIEVKLKPAQGTGAANYPTVTFANHAVVGIQVAPNKFMIFDPSYGGLIEGATPQELQLKWEKDNIVQFVFGKKLPDGMIGDLEYVPNDDKPQVQWGMKKIN